jgi:hypothetical protein
MLITRSAGAGGSRHHDLKKTRETTHRLDACRQIMPSRKVTGVGPECPDRIDNETF